MLFEARRHEYHHSSRNYRHWPAYFIAAHIFLFLAQKDARNYDSSRSPKVDFGANLKRVWDLDFQLVLNINLGPILPRFRYMEFLYAESNLSISHSYSGQNFEVFHLK